VQDGDDLERPRLATGKQAGKNTHQKAHIGRREVAPQMAGGENFAR